MPLALYFKQYFHANFKDFRTQTAAIFLAGLLCFFEASAQTVLPCEREGNIDFICGVPTPEDLLQIPGTDWIIGSGLADLKNPIPFSGSLVLINGKSRTAAVIALNPSDIAQAPYQQCKAPPDAALFSAHGIDIRPSGATTFTLFVVGHGAREAIEVFEIETKAAVPKITWIGCVIAAAGAFNNSVVGLSGGRILVTDFLSQGAGFKDLYAGRVTGALYLWSPGGVFEKLPGTDMSGPNGLAVSVDEKYVFVADSGKASVLRFDLAATTKPPVLIDPGLRTDNIRWAPDGRSLLLAGPIPDPECRKTGAVCREMQIVKAFDPTSFALKTVMMFRATAAFDYLSSALITGDTLWLGSPNGNGVAHTKLPQIP
jgi:hypothetical protein